MQDIMFTMFVGVFVVANLILLFGWATSREVISLTQTNGSDGSRKAFIKIALVAIGIVGYSLAQGMDVEPDDRLVLVVLAVLMTAGHAALAIQPFGESEFRFSRLTDGRRDEGAFYFVLWGLVPTMAVMAGAGWI